MRSVFYPCHEKNHRHPGFAYAGRCGRDCARIVRQLDNVDPTTTDRRQDFCETLLGNRSNNGCRYIK